MRARLVDEMGAVRVLLYRPPWRGTEPYFRATQVAELLGQRGDRVSVVAGPHGWRSLARLLAWPLHLARSDLVFLYPQPLLPFFALWARWSGRRVVIDHFVSYVDPAEVPSRLGRVLAPLQRVAYRSADAVLAHTTTVAEELVRAYGLAAGRVHTLYCLVDTAHFAPLYATAASCLRRELGIGDCFVVLYHGAWHRWHGLETLREAVARLVAQGERVALVMIGQAGQGAAHERLLPAVPYRHLPPYLQMGDVWCSGFASTPRGDRSFSSTLIQALAMGLPVITSPSPEKAGILRHEETALFAPLDDCAALAETIRFCRLHPDATVRVGAAGRRLAQETFDLAGLRELLERLLSGWFGSAAGGAR
jgi:glycosyltransferase involved in cell wall biosynthesis